MTISCPSTGPPRTAPPDVSLQRANGCGRGFPNLWQVLLACRGGTTIGVTMAFVRVARPGEVVTFSFVAPVFCPRTFNGAL
jgi:hypothetical protein